MLKTLFFGRGFFCLSYEDSFIFVKNNRYELREYIKRTQRWYLLPYN